MSNNLILAIMMGAVGLLSFLLLVRALVTGRISMGLGPEDGMHRPLFVLDADRAESPILYWVLCVVVAAFIIALWCAITFAIL